MHRVLGGDAGQESWPRKEEPARQAESVQIKRCAIFLMHAFAADIVYALMKRDRRLNSPEAASFWRHEPVCMYSPVPRGGVEIVCCLDWPPVMLFFSQKPHACTVCKREPGAMCSLLAFTHLSSALADASMAWQWRQ